MQPIEDPASYQWLEVARRLQSIAQAGLTYGENKYDRERYEELKKISIAMMAEYSDTPFEKIKTLYDLEDGYLTPKVDVRSVIFQNNKLLMVKETIDGCWSIPGGWADVGYTPSEIAVKETQEEAGLEVIPVRLLAVLDKKCHPHPPTPFYTYKIFILCEPVGGSPMAGMETSEVSYFGLDELPELSAERITASQIQLLFEYLHNPAKPVIFD